MTKSITYTLLAALLIFPLTAHAADEAQAQVEAAAEEAAKTGEAVKAEETKSEEKKAEAQKEEKPVEESAAKEPEQTAVEQEVAKDPVVAKNKAAYEKAVAKATDALKDVGQDLKEDDAKHFFMTYQNYNLIGTVKMVQTDVGNAIKACGDNNPEMKDTLDGRFTDWSNAVNPVIEEADANINNMVVAQEYTSPAKVKKVFKALDEARVATNASVEKTPVTTKDACESLLDTMDDTEKNLIELLRSTLVSYGRLYPEQPKDEPAEQQKL